MTRRLQWGILGTGNIAGQFAQGVHASSQGELAAVASRRLAAAQAFAAQHHMPAHFKGYQALLDDPTIDAVYIALPNNMHCRWTLAALRAGKHVLCEKPLAVTLEEAQQMFDEACKQDKTLVEAFMYRSHPQTRAVLDHIRAGTVGKLRMIRTSFCFSVKNTAGNIRFDPDLAGGSMMDIGCYCLNFTRLLAGEEPDQFSVIGHLHKSGVDDYAAAVLRFPSGILASFACGMALQSDNAAVIAGTEGYITVPWPWKPQGATVRFHFDAMTPPRQDKTASPGPGRRTIEVNADKPLYALEADHFAATVRGQRPPAVTPADTLENTRLLVEARRQLGLHF